MQKMALNLDDLIEEKMQSGYEKFDDGDSVGACEDWLECWIHILTVARQKNFRKVDEFDDWFTGTQSLFNWSQDFEMELWNAGLEDSRFFQSRIRFCDEFISQWDDPYFTDSFTSISAETYFKLGQKDKAHQLFDALLKRRPTFGPGWVRWADCFYLVDDIGSKNLAYAEALLKRALSVPGLEEVDFVWERLSDILAEIGKSDEAAIAKANSIKAFEEDLFDEYGVSDGWDPAEITMPRVAGQKTGRNEPCPCGSSKKYKKCCLEKE